MLLKFSSLAKHGGRNFAHLVLPNRNLATLMVNTKKIRKVSSEGAYPLLIFQHSDLGGVNFVEKFVYCQELNLIDNPALMK